MSEAQDIARAQAGDAAAAGRVLAAHRGLIVRWCKQMIEPGLDFDDAMQEAHVAGMAAIRWFKPGRGCKFPSYLKRCVRNRLAMWRRDRRQLPFLQRPLSKPGEEDQTEPIATPPPDNLVLMPMVRNLSKRDRRILELRYGLGGGGPLGVVTVGRLLHLSAAEVKRVEAEALADLRFLAGRGHDPAD